MVVRALSVLAGLVLVVVALALFLLPEVALPIAVAGLGLLALEFEWAARALAWTLERWEASRRWWRGLSLVGKAAVVVVAVGLLVGGTVWLL